MIAVLCSGGIDSMSLAYMAKADLVALIFVDYGQPAVNEEREAVTRIADSLGVEMVVTRIAIPEVADTMEIGPGVSGPRVVHGRNLLMLAHAVAYASARGWSDVWYGATADDRHGYPDCRISFLGGVQACAEAYGVKVSAPLVDIDGSGVVRAGYAAGAPLRYSWSCYEPIAPGMPCGGCNSCIRRRALLDTMNPGDWP